MTTWFVVHVAHGSDAKAREILTRLGVVSYAPMLRELRIIPRDRLSRQQRRAAASRPIARYHIVPLFPRYLFVALDPQLMPRAAFAEAGIEGVVSASGKGGLQPYRFPQEAIDAFRALEVGDPPAIPGETAADVIFKIGDEVKIVDGVLADQVAKIAAMPSLPITEIDSDTRLSVAVAAFGRVLDVELPISQVVKLIA